MSKIISQTQITAAIHRAQATIKADVTGLQNISLNLQPLGSVLQNISSAGYLSGIKATGDVHPQQGIQNISNTAAIASSTNWDKWTPGDAAAAAQTADGGLADLLAAQGAVIKGIGDTTLTRIGNVISDGLAQGSSVDQISRDIRDFLDNPDRADMIATTEANRAQTAAASEQLNAMGFTQFNWLAYDGACDDCLEQEDSNPHDLSDDQPPGHPNCRCAITGDGEAGLPDTGTSDLTDLASQAISGATGVGADEAIAATEAGVQAEESDTVANYATRAAAERDLSVIRDTMKSEIQSNNQSEHALIDDMEARTIAVPPKGTAGEYDWFYQLSGEERNRLLTNGWATNVKTGEGGFDQHVDILNRKRDTDLSVDEVARQWVGATRKIDVEKTIDSKGSLPSGRQLQNAYGDLDVNSLATSGPYKVDEIFASKQNAIDSLMTIRTDSVSVQEAADLVRNVSLPPAYGMSPIDMTEAQFVTKFFDLLGDAEDIDVKYASDTSEFGPIMTAEEQTIVKQWNAFFPQSLRTLYETDFNFNPAAIYQAIQDAVKLTS